METPNTTTAPNSLRSTFVQHFEEQLFPNREKGEASQTLIDLVTNRLNQEVGQRLFDAFEGPKNPEQMLTRDLLLLSLTTAIPPKTDFTLQGGPRLNLKGLELRAPIEGRQESRPIIAKYHPDIEEKLFIEAKPHQVDLEEEMRPSAEFFTQRLKNKLSQHSIQTKLIGLIGEVREIPDNIAEKLLQPGTPLYEAYSGDDLNTKCIINVRALMSFIFHTEALDNAEAILFHYAGVYYLEKGEIHFIPANPSYEALFFSDDQDRLIALKKANQTLKMDNKKVIDFGVNFRKRINKAIKGILEGREDLSDLEMFCQTFKKQTELQINPENIRNIDRMTDPELQEKLLRFFTQIAPFTKQFFREVIIKYEHPKSPSADPKNEHAIQMEIRRNHQSLLSPEKGISAGKTVYLTERDLRALSQFEDTYSIFLFQELMKKACVNLLIQKGPLLDELIALIGETEIQKNIRILTGRGFKTREERTRQKAIAIPFINYGMLYLTEMTDGRTKDKLPPAFREFFSRLINPPKRLAGEQATAASGSVIVGTE